MGIAVESAHDERVYCDLLSRCLAEDITWVKRKSRRRGHGFIKEMSSILESFRIAEVEFAVIIIDADTTTPQGVNARLKAIEAEIPTGSADFVVGGVVVKNLEALFLADEVAFRVVFNHVVPRQADPESIADPSERLSAIINQCTRGADDLSVNYFADLIAAMRTTEVEKRCPHFGEIVDACRSRIDS